MHLVFSPLSWGEMFSHGLRFISSLCFNTSNKFLEDRPYIWKVGEMVEDLRVAWLQSDSSRAEVRSGTCCASFPQWHPHSGCCLQEELWTTRKESYPQPLGESMVEKGKVLGRAGFQKLLSMIEKVFEILFGSRNPHSVQKLIQEWKKRLFSCDSLIVFIRAHFPPVCFQKGLTQVSISPEGRIEKHKEWGPLH